jgi:hypothetical protein
MRGDGIGRQRHSWNAEVNARVEDPFDTPERTLEIAPNSSDKLCLLDRFAGDERAFSYGIHDAERGSSGKVLFAQNRQRVRNVIA